MRELPSIYTLIAVKNLTTHTFPLPGDTPQKVQMSGVHQHGDAVSGRAAHVAAVGVRGPLRRGLRAHGAASGRVPRRPAAVQGEWRWRAARLPGYRRAVNCCWI